jgi:hypothetical protein
LFNALFRLKPLSGSCQTLQEESSEGGCKKIEKLATKQHKQQDNDTNNAKNMVFII